MKNANYNTSIIRQISFAEHVAAVHNIFPLYIYTYDILYEKVNDSIAKDIYRQIKQRTHAKNKFLKKKIEL